MATHEQIYLNQADAYEFMISKQPDLSEFIGEIRPLHGLDILDLGAGSGRLSVFLAKEAKSLVCTDISSSMLALLNNKLMGQGIPRNWKTVIADHKQLPISDEAFDLVVSGWSISYLTNSGNKNWEENLEIIISEMNRVLKPAGTIVIIETLGTGTESPNPPEFLTDYYKALKEKYGFNKKWIRTDYKFNSVEEARETLLFSLEMILQRRSWLINGRLFQSVQVYGGNIYKVRQRKAHDI